MQKAKSVYESTKEIQGLAFVNNGMASSYLMLIAYPRAINHAWIAARQAARAQISEAYLSAHEKLVEAHRKLGNTEVALRMQDKVIRIADSLDDMAR